MASSLKIVGLVCFFSSAGGDLPTTDPSGKVIRLCKSDNVVTDSIQIPTLIMLENFVFYSLETFSVDWKNPLSKCPNGDEPLNDNVKTLTLNEYNRIKGILDTDSILRQSVIFLASGYLGVPNDDHSIMYYSLNEFCLDEVKGSGYNVKLDLKLCPVKKQRPVLRKCCPMNMIFDMAEFKCIVNDMPLTWDNFYLDAQTGKNVPMDTVHPAYLSPVQQCPTISIRFYDKCTDGFYPTTDNTMALVTESRSLEYWNEDRFCMEKAVANNHLKSNGSTVLVFCSNSSSGSLSESGSGEVISYLSMFSLYIGSLFHLLTTLAYMITWKKQNIHGKTLCSCTTALFFMQLSLGTAHLLSIIGNKQGTGICLLNAVTSQFFLIGSFVWLSIVNFDLWRKFRSVQIEVRVASRFLAYCGAGWGVPFFISLVSVIMDMTFPCRTSKVLTPEFGKVICFVAPWAQGVYVYSFLGASMAISILFAGLAVYELLKVKLGQRLLRAAVDEKKRETLLLILKLSVVMGISWAFEVIGWAASPQGGHGWGWILVDLYNALSSVIIFVIFVCKKSTLTLVEEAAPFVKRITTTFSKSSKLSPSSTQNEIYTPKDPATATSSVHFSQRGSNN